MLKTQGMIFRIFSVLCICFLSWNMMAQTAQPTIIVDNNLVTLEVDRESIYNEVVHKRSSVIDLPFDRIGHGTFNAIEMPFFSETYQKKRPDAKTYKISSIKDRAIRGNLLVTENGIWSTLNTKEGLVSIYMEEGQYFMERGIAHREHGHSKCTHDRVDEEVKEYVKQNGPLNTQRIDFSNGTTRRDYSLALVCTGEYYVLNGNSDGLVSDAMSASIMGISAIFQDELAVRFFPVNIELFRNKDTDPFTPTDGGGRTDEASIGVAAAFPNVNSYDIGHAFHRTEEGDGWGSGGVARLFAVCNSNISDGGAVKAKGWSASGFTAGNGFISLAAHEFAHMFSATHTFNGSGGFNGSTTCTDAIGESSSYEIGSGTTIMSYNGLCDEDQNIAASGTADNYFHVHSISQMLSFISTGADCNASVPLDNTPPVVNTNQCGGTITIPKNTPFFLKGNAGDQENENITYCWEQYDEDGEDITPTMGFIGTSAANSPLAPLFRSFPPTNSSTRYFPDLETLVNGANSDPFQALPNRQRTLHFQLTARDNNAEGGGIASAEVDVVVDDSGPMAVQNINTIDAGIAVNYTWTVNGTEALCDKAKLLFSIDGGATFPFTIADDIDYASGSTMLMLSDAFPATEDGRIMLVCDDQECYSFFDISNNPITVNSGCGAEATAICDIKYEVFDQGAPSLDLNLNVYNGAAVSNATISIRDDADSQVEVGMFSDDTQTSCATLDIPTQASALRKFVVDEAGEYTFGVGDGICAVYRVGSFDPNNVCSGNSFVGGNAYKVTGTSWQPFSSFTVTLDDCEEYYLYATNLFVINFPADYSINNVSGPGSFILVDEEPNVEYANTFIAIDEQGKIRGISPTSDFTALAGGEYDIYGVSYKVGGPTPPAIVDPALWLGQDLTDIQVSDCMLLSTNSKKILIEFTCRINSIETGVQTACDAVSNLYTQEITVTYEDPPTTGTLLINGNPFAITGSPQTEVLSFISDGQDVGIDAEFSENTGCTLFVPNLFTAPANCCGLDFDLGGDRAICSGEAIILDAGEEGNEYNWTLDGVPLAEEGSMLEVTASGNYGVEVIKNGTCFRTEIVNIIVFETPNVELEEDFSICEGELFSLQSTTSASVIEWYRNGVLLMGETDASLLITQPGEYVMVGASEFEQADMTIISCSSSDTVNIDFVTRPIVDLGDDQELCVDESPYILNAGNGGTIYSWTRNGTVVPMEDTPMLSVEQNGQYIAIVDNGGGCETQDTVIVNFIEDAEVVIALEELNICIGSTEQLQTFINATSYQWFFNGVLYSDQNESPMVSDGGEYVLIGENAIGCQVSDTITINSITPPIIDLGEDKVACIGSEVPLSIDSLGIILWLKDGNQFSNNASVVITEPGQYIVNIIPASDCGARDTINVSFEPGPSLDLGMGQNLCEGDIYTIMADSDGDNITWFRDGIEIIGESTFELDVSAAGVYSALVLGASGCEVEDEVEIIVNEVPMLELDPEIAICDGEDAMLSTELMAASYEWIFNGMTISNDPQVSVSEEGEYTLIVENEFGCSDQANVQVTANARPDVVLEDMYAICEGEEAVIVAEGDGVTFEWVVNGTVLMGETTNMIMLDEAANVEVIASSSAGCTNNAFTMVSEAVAPSVDLGEDTSLCPGDSYALDAGAQSMYEWSTGTDDATFIVVSSGPDQITTETFSVTVTSAEGCTAMDEVEITFFPAINGMVDQSATGVCDGEPVQLTASGGTFYEWVPDNEGTLTDIDGANALASPTETTTYQVIVSDDCPGNEDIVIIEIEVFEPDLNLDAGEDDCVVDGNTIDLNASGGTAYSWVDDSSIVSGRETANPTVMPTEETTYIVDITDSNGCIFRDSVNICLLDDPLEGFKLVSIITPNGDGENDELRFVGLEAFPENSLEIYNRWGLSVYQQRGYQINGELFNGSSGGQELPADTYYYILQFDGQVYKSDITILR